MREEKHFDASGEFVGRTQSVTVPEKLLGQLVAIALFFCLVAAAAQVLTYLVGEPARHPAPYRWASYFYHVLFAWPWRLGGAVWDIVTAPGLTTWPNLNALLGVLLAAALWAAPYGAIAYGASMVRNGRRWLAIAVAAPAVAALAWWMLSSLSGWLFSR